MLTEELDYVLPQELIAQQPAENRQRSRLLVLYRQTGRMTDASFADIGEFLRPGDCLVLNDTKVIPARFFASRTTGGKLEGLFLRQEDKDRWLVMLKGLGKVKAGERIRLKNVKAGDFCVAQVLEKKADPLRPRSEASGKCLLKSDSVGSAEKILEKIGFPPLPPYIRRDTDLQQAAKDKIRYQTVYARRPGAIAAPTAGLHFTKKLLKQLKKQGVLFAYVTLAVGEGTFKPVTTETLEAHRIHEEQFSINEKNASIINQARRLGGRIIAVGTTSVRVLETATAKGKLQATSGTTSLFIRPGCKFKIVDAMVTNFHLPRSTLLALVAAFAGLDTTLAAYAHAVNACYRFYSYGDAMLII